MTNTATSLSSVIVPSIFNPYTLEQSVEKNALLKSGVVTRSPILDEKLAGGGLTYNIPTWRNTDQSSTAANIPSDDNSVLATPEAMIARDQIVPRLERNKIWAASDVVRRIAGSDPMAAVANYAADAMNKWRQASLISVLQGVTNDSVSGADANRTNNIYSDVVAGSRTSAMLYSAGTIVDTFSVFSDHADDASGYAILMHPDVYRYLIKNDFTSFQRQAFQTYGLGQPSDAADAGGMHTYLGMQVLVDARVPTSVGTNATSYTTYIIKPDAVIFGMGTVANQFAVQRFEREGNGAGVEYLAARDAYSYHVNGFKWTGSPVATFPSDAELATYSNWTQVLSTKQIGIAALVANIK